MDLPFITSTPKSKLDEELSDGEKSDVGLEIVLESPRSKKKKTKPKSLEIDVGDKEIIASVEEELEKNLEEKAAKYNCSSVNVKNLLKNVITNEHVLAMVKQAEDPDSSGTDMQVFEPKLTRSKAKELCKASPPIPWKNPKPPPAEVQVLISEELHEESDDDEYVPEKEESEDDRDSSVVSELESSLPPTPSQEHEPQTNFTDDGMFKIPPSKEQEIEEANIALRTRSKLSLSHTPLETIEQAFIPPDITTDMYEVECDENWAEFLKTFTKPMEEVLKTNEDDDHDPEYNILSDMEDIEMDPDELRADKAVTVTRKELNELISELFEYADVDPPPKKTLDTHASIQTPPNIEVPVPEKQVTPKNNLDQTDSRKIEQPPNEIIIEEIPANVTIEILLAPPCITEEQKYLLQQQMMQHIQMLTQNFILAYGTTHKNIALKSKSCLDELFELKNKESCSYYDAINLDPALNLVKQWQDKVDSRCDDVLDMEEHYYHQFIEYEEALKAGSYYPVAFANLVMDFISNSSVFIYPGLLPQMPFVPIKTCLPPIFNSEDHLIALGLEQFMEFVDQDKYYKKNNKKTTSIKAVVHYIHKYLMPVRPFDALYRHVLVTKQKKIPANPITYYFTNGSAPIFMHYVINLNDFGVAAPKFRSKELLPYKWRKYLFSEHNDVAMNVSITKAPPRLLSHNIIPTIVENLESIPGDNYRKIVAKQDPVNVYVDTRKHPFTKKHRIPFRDAKGHFLSAAKQQIIRRFSVSTTGNKLSNYFKNTPPSGSKFLPQLTNLKFNSTIFSNSNTLDLADNTCSTIELEDSQDNNQTLTNNMLPSMPSIQTHKKKETEANKMTDSNIQNKPTNNPTMEELEDNRITKDTEEDDGKDNMDDINALMVASSTIKNISKKAPSGSEKKKLKIRKEFLAHMTLLSPEDPTLVHEKANSYVQAYYDKVQEKLEVHEYHQFMQILNNFDYRTTSISTLYEEICKILLPKYSDLADEFLTFLTPVEAKTIGKSKPHFMLRNMSLFLHKLGIYYKDQPSQLRKVYRSLTDLASCVDASMEMVKASILPLLKGNSLLTDWFLQIFPSERPPDTLMNGSWETVDVTREPIYNEEIFETVVIPDSEDPYGGSHCICTCHETDKNAYKLRHQHCIACGKRFLQGRVYVQTSKGLRLANISFEGNAEEHIKRLSGFTPCPTKKRADSSPNKQVSPTKDNQDEHRMSNDSEEEDCGRKKSKPKTPRKRKLKVSEKIEKPPKKTKVQNGKTNVVTEVNVLEKPTEKTNEELAKELPKESDQEGVVSQESGPETQESCGENEGRESGAEIDVVDSCGENDPRDSCDEQDGRESFDENDGEDQQQTECQNANGHLVNGYVEKSEEKVDQQDANENIDQNSSKEKVEATNTSDSSIEPKPPEEVNEWDCNTSIESIELKLSPDQSAGSESEIYEESSQDNMNSDCDESEDDAVSLTQSPQPHSENSNSNTFEEVTWAREEDKLILLTLREMGNTEDAINHIAKELSNKTVDQIKSRFETLLSLLQQMAAASSTD